MPSEQPEYLPVKYIVAIYENSFAKDNCRGSVETNAPLHPIHVDDYISAEASDTWGAGIEAPEKHVLRVIAVRHFFARIGQTHIIHSMSVCVQAIPAPVGF